MDAGQGRLCCGGRACRLPDVVVQQWPPKCLVSSVYVVIRTVNVNVVVPTDHVPDGNAGRDVRYATHRTGCPGDVVWGHREWRDR